VRFAKHVIKSQLLLTFSRQTWLCSSKSTTIFCASTFIRIKWRNKRGANDDIVVKCRCQIEILDWSSRWRWQKIECNAIGGLIACPTERYFCICNWVDDRDSRLIANLNRPENRKDGSVSLLHNVVCSILGMRLIKIIKMSWINLF